MRNILNILLVYAVIMIILSINIFIEVVMLIEFTVGNFLSFKEKKTFSMLASSISELEEDNTFKVNEKVKLLKSAAIYGANASGKSNLVEALSFVRDFIVNSSKESQQGEPIDVENYRLSTETDNKPSFFEIVFVYENIKYRYGFEVDEEKVHSEWLFTAKFSNKTLRETKLFIREFNEIEINEKQFKEGKLVKEGDKTRFNSLFLSVNAQFNGKISSQIFDWIRKFCIVIQDSIPQKFSKKKLKHPKFKNYIMELIRICDVGIEDLIPIERKVDINVFPIEKQMLYWNRADEKGKLSINEVESIHKKFNNNNELVDLVNFDFELDESDGTIKLFELSTPIIDTLMNWKVLIIDELDNSMHPNLCKLLINLFNSKETNRKGAQLIFTTHDTTLLKKENFRRDQIWFTEKDKYGATDLYSLVEFKVSDSKGVRKDASYDKDYIVGKYGAIPFLGSPATIFGAENE